MAVVMLAGCAQVQKQDGSQIVVFTSTKDKATGGKKGGSIEAGGTLMKTNTLVPPAFATDS